MQRIFRVVVNQADERRIDRAEEVDHLCTQLAERPVFTVHVTRESGLGPSLDIFVESGRALVSYLDIERGVKLASRDENCTQKGFVSLRNDAYPGLDLDLIEVQCRDLIAPKRALTILRHYLRTGE